MAYVSIYKGGTEYRFPDLPGYRPVLKQDGSAELVVDPNYQPPEQLNLPGMSRESLIGQKALFNIDSELESADA